MRLRAATLASHSPLCRRSSAAAVPASGSGARGNTQPASGGRRGHPRLCASSPAGDARSARRSDARRADRDAPGLRAPDRAALQPLPADHCAGRPGAEARPWRPDHLDRHPAPGRPLSGRHAFQRGGGPRQLAALAEPTPPARGCCPTSSRSMRPRPDEVRFLLDQPVPDLVASTVLSAARDRLSARARSSERAGAGFLADATGSGTGAFQLGPRGPGRSGAPSLRRLVGKLLGLGPSLDGVTFVLAPQPASGCGFSGMARSRSPIRSGRSGSAPRTPIPCLRGSAGRSPGSASRARSGGSTPPSPSPCSPASGSPGSPDKPDFGR